MVSKDKPLTLLLNCGVYLMIILLDNISICNMHQMPTWPTVHGQAG